MNPKERVQSIAIVTITAIALAVRIQSSPPKSLETTVASAPTNERTLEPGVSRGVLPYTTGFRAQTFVDNDGPTVEASGQPLTNDVYEPPAVVEDPEIVYLEAPGSGVSDPDVFIEIASDSDLPWDMSDQQVIDQMLSILSDEQRLAFRDMWSTLDSAQKRDWIDQLRTAMAG